MVLIDIPAAIKDAEVGFLQWRFAPGHFLKSAVIHITPGLVNSRCLECPVVKL